MKISIVNSSMDYQLVEQHLYLVNRLGKSLMRVNSSNPYLELSDLVGAGYMALLDAGREYDSSMGVPFKYYAIKSIRRAMVKEIKKLTPVVILNIDDYEGDLDDLRCNWEAEQAYLLERLQFAMNQLTPIERQLIEQRYGFLGKSLKLRELAEIMDVSFQAVDKRINRILNKLRSYFDDPDYSKCA